MNRLYISTLTALTLSLSINSAFAEDNTHRQNHRYCEPSQSCWPKPNAWQSLKKKVGGRLVIPKDIIAGCKKDFRSLACKKETKMITNPFALQTTPGGSESKGYWEAWSYENSNYAVVAKNESDVVAAVNFARQHNLRLIIKGAGHDYLGRSNGKNSLLIWTHNLQTLHYNKSSRTMTVGAGVDWLQVYQKAAKYGRYVLGGGCTSVGAVGGFTLGGGFGSFSRKYGTGAGNLLSAKVVLANGKWVNATPTNQYRDLLKALRGGGPGFGVVTQMTYKTYPLPKRFGGVTIVIGASTDDADKKLIHQLLAFIPSHVINEHWGETIEFYGGKSDSRTHGKSAIVVSMASPDLNIKALQSTWAPFMAWVKKRKKLYSIAAETYSQIPANKFYNIKYLEQRYPTSIIKNQYPGTPKHMFWFAGMDSGQIYDYWTSYQSWWLPLKLFQKHNLGKLTNAIYTAEQSTMCMIALDKGLARASKNALKLTHETMMNPAVTKAAGLIIMAGSNPNVIPGVPGHTPQSHSGELSQSAAQINGAIAPFKELAPYAGTYINEASYFNRNWPTDFWGAKNYKQLQEIKFKYDQTGLFSCHHCVIGKN